MPQFNRYIGIDYSGAKTCDSSCNGLRVYVAEGSGEPKQVQPPPSPRRYWTRRGLAEWLCNELDGTMPTIVGIDHAFSFPLAYFEKYRLSSDWQDFLVDFLHHWPIDARNTYVSFIRDGNAGLGAKRTGNRGWFRLTEQWTPAAKSVFGFGVQGEVATSTHAGLRGSSISGSSVNSLFTSGRSTDGKFLRGPRQLLKSTRLYGREDSLRMAEMATSKLPMSLRLGCNEQTSVAH